MANSLCPLIIGSLILVFIAPSKAEAFKALESYAQRVTLPIVTPANGGSITIIGKKDSTYTFLTAAHVIAGTAKGEINSIDLSSQVGRDLFVEATIKKDFSSDGIDLAIGTFQYVGKTDLEVLPLFGLAPDAKWEDDPSQYKKVSLPCDDKTLDWSCTKTSPMYGETDCYYMGYGKAPCDKPPMVSVTRRLSMGTYDRFEGIYNNKRYDIKTASIGDYAVAGYSLPSRSITERVLRISFAVPQNLLSRNKDGYNLIYEATSTVPGMSGGPVLAARLCPGSELNAKRGNCTGSCGNGAYAGIIGVHGKSEEYSNTGSRSGISLAIPINSPLVVQYLNSNAMALGIPSGNSYVQLVNQSCSNRRSFFN